MSLSLFDESGRPEGPAPDGARSSGRGAPGRPEARPVSLVRLATEIARSMAGVGRVVVEGEAHQPKVYGATVFFVLRDRAAQIQVRVPASVRARVRAGDRVAVVASLQWQPERGQAHLVAESVTPVGAGAIAALIAEIRGRLVAEGLIGRPPRTIPVLPTAIGVVCGSDAAVRKDIESVVAARCPGYPLHFEETTVSGPAASTSIVAAIEAVTRRPGIEVIILARGGGDAPSLLPWSQEEVCRAVAASPVPVVSAIGHESDRPLCDEVADLRCGTPSLAATTVLPDLAALRAAADGYLERAAAGLGASLVAAGTRLAGVAPAPAVHAGLDRAGSRLERAALRLGACHPGGRTREAAGRLAALQWRSPFWETFGRCAGRLEAERRHLTALSPQRTLERGYAVVRDSNGEVVRDATSVAADDRLSVTLAAGRLGVTVETVEP